MRLSLLSFSLLLLSTSARARFYTADDLPARPAGFDRAYAAALRLGELNSGGDHCSAISVSRDGHVLTNLHCVEACLQDAGFSDRGLESVKGEHYTVLRTRQQRPRGVSCPNLEWDDASGQSHLGGAVVWLGRGTQTFSDVDVLSITPDAFRDVLDHMDDFAVLKYAVAAPTPCVPRALVAPAPGDPVWGIGYPNFTMRYDGFDSSGYKKHVSMGRVMTDLRADPYLSARVTSEAQWAREEQAYGRPELLLSSLDSMHGSSGSMVIDGAGRLVAVHFSNTAPSSERMKVDLGSNSISLRVDHVFEELSAGLGRAEAQRIFDCPEGSPAVEPPSPRAPALPRVDAASPGRLFDGSGR